MQLFLLFHFRVPGNNGSIDKKPCLQRKNDSWISSEKSVIKTYALVRREFVLTEVFLKNENINLVNSFYALEATNYIGSLLPLTRKELTEKSIQNYSSDFYHCLNFYNIKVCL